MNDRLTKLLTAYKDALQLANSLYAMYKDQRQRADAYESQVREAIATEPMTDKDWQQLRKKVEADEPSTPNVPFD